MADLPIPYQPPMILALLEERKTQTRRTFGKLRRFGEIREFGRSDTPGYDWHFRDKDGRLHYLRHDELLPVLKYRVGDRLYVREHWRTTGAFEDLSPSKMSPGNTRVKYIADGFVDNRGKSFDHFHEGRFRQGMHMPKWASRLTQIVNEVRVQRLHDITEEDAIAEGIAPHYNGGFHVPGLDHPDPNFPYLSRTTAREMYAALWDMINGSGEWLRNPWIAAYTVKTIKSNIDQIGGDA